MVLFTVSPWEFEKRLRVFSRDLRIQQKWNMCRDILCFGFVVAVQLTYHERGPQSAQCVVRANLGHFCIWKSLAVNTAARIRF